MPSRFSARRLLDGQQHSLTTAKRRTCDHRTLVSSSGRNSGGAKKVRYRYRLVAMLLFSLDLRLSLNPWILARQASFSLHPRAVRQDIEGDSAARGHCRLRRRACKRYASGAQRVYLRDEQCPDSQYREAVRGGRRPTLGRDGDPRNGDGMTADGGGSRWCTW